MHTSPRLTAPSSWTVEELGFGSRISKSGRPSLLVGGQVHNSSSSTVEAIIASFEHAKKFGANTVLAPLSWAQFEPEEGRFDLTLVDAMLEHARRLELRLVLLWFGAFKNAGSTYAPSWVRGDLARFPRVSIHPIGLQAFTYEGATKKPVLSVFGLELRESDARAVESLFIHLAEADLDDTVAMVQLENETGLLADGRDRSDLAELAWHSPVPHRLVDFLEGKAPAESKARDLWESEGSRRRGTWPELLGSTWEAEEIFMAWSFAEYVEHLALRATAIKSIPVYANAWLGPQPGQDRAGQYPSGGPGSRVLDIWRFVAPTLALLGPDIYVDDAHAAMRNYALAGQPLFIPECRFSAAELLRAVGSYGAIGWSAFGVDEGNPNGQVAGALRFLSALETEISEAGEQGNVMAVVLEHGQTEAHLDLAGLRVVVRDSKALYRRMLVDAGVQLPELMSEPASETLPGAAIPFPGETRPFGLLLADSPDSITVIGQGLTVDFFSEEHRIEIDAATRLEVVDGGVRSGTVLNGDERLRLVPDNSVGGVRIQLLRL